MGTAVTDSNGEFSVNVDTSSPVEIVITGGSFKDEATGQTVDISAGQELSCVVPDGSSAGSAVVTPLTHIAAAQAKENMQSGQDPVAAVNSANQNVADQFGIPDVDITKTDPEDLTEPGSGSDPDSDASKYGLIIAAISHDAANKGKSPDQMIDHINGMKEDLKGQFLRRC